MYKMSPAQFANLSSRERILAGMAGLSASRNATETYHESGAKQGFVHEGGSFTDMIHATLNAPNVGTIISGGSHVVSNTPAEFELTPHWREGYTRLPGSAVMPGHQGVQSRGLRGFLAGLGVFAPEAMGESTRGGQSASGRSTGTVAPPGAGGPAAGSGVRTVAAVMAPMRVAVTPKMAPSARFAPAALSPANLTVIKTAAGPALAPIGVKTLEPVAPAGAKTGAVVNAPPKIWTIPPGMKAPVYTGTGANTGTEGSSGGSGGSGTAQTLPDTGSTSTGGGSSGGSSGSSDTGSGGSSSGSDTEAKLQREYREWLESGEGAEAKVPTTQKTSAPGAVKPTPWAFIGGLVAVAGAVWYYSK